MEHQDALSSLTVRRFPVYPPLLPCQTGDVMVFAQKPDGSLVVAGRVANKVRQLDGVRLCS